LILWKWTNPWRLYSWQKRC